MRASGWNKESAASRSRRASQRLLSRSDSNLLLEVSPQRSFTQTIDATVQFGNRTSSIKRTLSVSPLLKLPPELRLAILRYILPSRSKKFKLNYTDCDSSYTDRKWNVERRPDKRPRVNPYNLAILRTNKQIYYEALSVLYSENSFHFVGFNFLPILDFIRRLSPESKGLVRLVKVTSTLQTS